MSVVAIKIYDDRIVMVADSIIVHGDTDKTPVGKGKIFEVNNMLIGSTGSAAEGVHMALFAENHTPLAMNERELTKYIYEFKQWRAKEFNIENELKNQYLIAYKDKAFYCNGTEYIGEIHDFYAIGVGQYYATAVLYLGHTPKEAVEVACALNCYVDKPIITKILHKEKI